MLKPIKFVIPAKAGIHFKMFQSKLDCEFPPAVESLPKANTRFASFCYAKCLLKPLRGNDGVV